MPKLLIGNKKVNYTVRRGGESRYVHLRFKSNLELEITLPKNSNLDPQAIIRKKRPWIENKYQQLSERKRVFDGKQVLYKGKYYELNATRSDKPTVRIGKGKIILSATDGADSKILLKDWMTRETQNFLRIEVPIYEKKLGVAIDGFKVEDTGRWGSCNRNGELTFNWQIIALPNELAEYVIIHEVSHLSEFNHSKNFHYKLASLCPDFMEREIMLKNITPISHKDFDHYGSRKELLNTQKHFTIVNVVATADVGTKLDLKRLSKAPAISYNPLKYRGMVAYFKDSQTHGKVSVFSSGKLISVGAKSVKQAKEDVKRTLTKLSKLGIKVPKKTIETLAVRNIVATANLGRPVDLEQITEGIYEPEQFPGAILQSKTNPHVKVLLFASGKVVIAGLQNTSIIPPIIEEIKILTKQSGFT